MTILEPISPDAEIFAAPINWKQLTGNTGWDSSIRASYPSLQEALEDLKKVHESGRAFGPLTTEDGSIFIDKAQIQRLWKLKKM